MAVQGGLEHPYSTIDVSQLDRRFLSLLAHSEELLRDRREAAGHGVRLREKLWNGVNETGSARTGQADCRDEGQISCNGQREHRGVGRQISLPRATSKAWYS